MKGLSRNQIFERHPLPWTARSLMIEDANRQQVIHLGGADYDRKLDPDYKVGLNALLVDLANRTLERQKGFRKTDEGPEPAPPSHLILNHEPGGWIWEFTDRECTDPVVLAGENRDILLLTTDAEGRYIIDIDDDHQTLLAHAYMVPHECDVQKCPGNIIRQRFEALKAAEELKLDHIDGLEVKVGKADILKILLSEFEYWKNVDSSVAIGAIGAISNCVAAITSDHRAPWHPKKPKAGTFDSFVIVSDEAEIAVINNWKVGTILRCRELQRMDRYFEITAIGARIVLGLQIREGIRGDNEIHLSLKDQFLEWIAISRNEFKNLFQK